MYVIGALLSPTPTPSIVNATYAIVDVCAMPSIVQAIIGTMLTSKVVDRRPMVSFKMPETTLPAGCTMNKMLAKHVERKGNHTHREVTLWNVLWKLYGKKNGQYVSRKSLGYGLPSHDA